MPSKNGSEEGYRQKAGTSIAVRIKPSSDEFQFDLKKRINEIVLNAEISVTVDNLREGEFNYSRQLETTVAQLDLSLESTFENLKASSPEIHLVSINLSGISPFISGKFYILLFNGNFEYHKELNHENLIIEIWPRILEGVPSSFNLRNGSGIINNDTFELRQSSEVFIPEEFITEELQAFRNKFGNRSLIITHNGIIIREKNKRSSLRPGPLDIYFYVKGFSLLGYHGIIELKDNFQPNLSISRESVKTFPWSLYSELNFVLLKALNKSDYEILSTRQTAKKKSSIFPDNFDFLLIQNKNIDLSLTDLSKDEYLLNKTLWPSFNLPFLEKKILDLENIESDQIASPSNPFHLFLRKIIELHFEYKVTLFHSSKDFPQFSGHPFHKTEFPLFIRQNIIENFKLTFSLSRRLDDSIFNQSYYPPMTFCEYTNFAGLVPLNPNFMPWMGLTISLDFINVNHPIGAWLKNSYAFLEENFPNYLSMIMKFQDLDQINYAIKRLNIFLPDQFKPGDDLHLTEKDFKVDFELLKEEEET